MNLARNEISLRSRFGLPNLTGGGLRGAPRVACCVAATLVVGCSTLFDAPGYEQLVVDQAGEMLEDAVRERAKDIVHQGLEYAEPYVVDGVEHYRRVIIFNSLGSTQEAEPGVWPVMRVESADLKLPQLVLESPVHGLVSLDERQIGLVQDGSARIVTLTAGEHVIRIDHPKRSPLVAQFYIEKGERITLRWESR